MFRNGCCLPKPKYPKKGKPEISRASETYWSSAQLVSYPRQDLSEHSKPIGAARRSLLEQRATGELSTAGPIGAARRLVRNLLEQRVGESLSQQDLLEQRVGPI